jgi:hypothetical protein
MKLPLEPTNASLWADLPAEAREGYQEVWHLKLNDPAKQRALGLRFVVLTSKNGFKRVAETWAVFFERGQNREVVKTVAKQTHELRDFSAGDGVRMAGCSLTGSATQGQVQAKGNSIRWDLKFQPAQDASFALVPRGLAKAGLIKNRVYTLNEDLRFSGTTEINGETLTWSDAPGMQGHFAGPRNAHSWTWGHCNSFRDEQGKASSTVFEGLTARVRLAGPLRSPKLSSFYFRYQDREYRFNTLWDGIHTRSRATLNQWNFRVERGELAFVGELRADYRDFAGLTLEDTDGSLLYCADSKLSDLKLLVYRSGKLEATLTAAGSAALEVVSRAKNPYVPLII